MDLLKLFYIIPFFFLSTGNSFSNDLPNIASDKEFFLDKKLELNISLSALAEFEKLNLLYQYPEIDYYLSYLLDKIITSNGIKDDKYSIFLISNNDLNAFALPGKYMGINTGLLLSTKDESELASVVSHELAHITKKHISRMIYAQKKATNVSLAALLLAILASNSNSNLTTGALAGAQANLAKNYFSYSQAHEKEADYTGFIYMKKVDFPLFLLSHFSRL
jgi:predicted Zn-dependent protease